jgi:hypothetical protein
MAFDYGANPRRLKALVLSGLIAALRALRHPKVGFIAGLEKAAAAKDSESPLRA